MRIKPVVLLASVFFFSGVSVALAASCGAGAPPAPGDIVGLVLYEVNHFLFHLGLTLNAAAEMIHSPEQGWLLLQIATDPTCVARSPFVQMLFSSPEVALVTLAFASVLFFAVVFSTLNMVGKLFATYHNTMQTRFA